MSLSVTRSTIDPSVFVVADIKAGIETTQSFSFSEGFKCLQSVKAKPEVFEWVKRIITKSSNAKAYDLRAQQQADAYTH